MFLNISNYDSTSLFILVEKELSLIRFENPAIRSKDSFRKSPKGIVKTKSQNDASDRSININDH